MLPKPQSIPDQPANYVAILKERATPDKLPQYPAVYTFVFVQDALDFINSRMHPNEWAMFRAVELEEKLVTMSKMFVKQ